MFKATFARTMGCALIIAGFAAVFAALMLVTVGIILAFRGRVSTVSDIGIAARERGMKPSELLIQLSLDRI